MSGGGSNPALLVALRCRLKAALIHWPFTTSSGNNYQTAVRVIQYIARKYIGVYYPDGPTFFSPNKLPQRSSSSIPTVYYVFLDPKHLSDCVIHSIATVLPNVCKHYSTELVYLRNTISFNINFTVKKKKNSLIFRRSTFNK